MRPPTGARPPWATPATRFRVGRILLVIVVLGTALMGGTIWLLTTKARPLLTPLAESAAWPPWLRQPQTYAAPAPESVKAPAPAPDPNAALLAKLAALQATLEEQQQAIEALKKRPSGTTMGQPPQPKATPVPPPPKPHTGMLFVAHEVKEGESKHSHEQTYTILPGSFVPCAVETAMNSDTGDVTFTAVTTTTVYDTATGRYPLILQGSKIVGEAQGSQLLYGNELMRTLSLTLSRRQDTAPIDLGKAPLTNQAGINGLASRVDSHFWRLVGAVFIGGALKGGTQAITTAVSGSGPIGAIGGGIAQTGQQGISQRVGPSLSTKPTIEVDAGQLCNVLLTKPLTLTVAH